MRQFGKFDDQDRILRRQPHGGQQPDLKIDIILQPARPHRNHCAYQTQGNDQQYGKGDRPAFIQRGQAQKDDEHGKRIKQRRLPARQLLLVGQAAPSIAGAGGQLLLQFDDPVHRFARTRAGASLSLNFIGGLTVETRNGGRSHRPVAGGEGGEGNHLAGRVRPHHPFVEIARQRAIGRIGLHINALHPAAIDEIIDVAAAPGGCQHIVDIALGQPQNGQFFGIDIDLELWRIFQRGGAHACKLRVFLRSGQQLIAQLQKARARQPAAIEQFKGEAVGLAKAANGRRRHRQHPRIADGGKLLVGPPDNCIGAVYGARPIAPRRQIDEALRGIFALARKAEAGHDEGEGDIVLLVTEEIILHLFHRASGPTGFRTGGQGHLHHHLPLILHRQKTGWEPHEQQD